jgi:hypothetical protein
MVHYISAPDTWRKRAGYEATLLVLDGKTVNSILGKMN